MIRRRLAAVGARLSQIASPILPGDLTTPEGQREAVTLYGLLLIAGGFLLANLAPLALLVPGTVLAAVGLAPTFLRRR